MEWFNDITQWIASEQVQAFITVVLIIIVGWAVLVHLIFMTQIIDGVTQMARDTHNMRFLLESSLHHQAETHSMLEDIHLIQTQKD
jgi:predicted PurR-regulated permease PerM